MVAVEDTDGRKTGHDRSTPRQGLRFQLHIFHIFNAKKTTIQANFFYRKVYIDKKDTDGRKTGHDRSTPGLLQDSQG